jgi:hypothetical protein
MKYTFLFMRSVDHFDSVITIEANPSRLDELLGRRKQILRYYGSGTIWRRGANGPRCNFLTCEWLHEIWSRQLNRAYDAGNTRRGKGVAEDVTGSR